MAYALITALLIAGIPAPILWRQRAGERELQHRLGDLLGGDCRWSPRPL